jgi:N-acetylmuramoyl-L-alanine amidase
MISASQARRHPARAVSIVCAALGWLLVVTACSSGTRLFVTADAEPLPTPEATLPPRSSVDAEQPARPAATVTPDPIPLGLVTPTGVTVSVIGRTEDGYMVRSPCGIATVVTDGEPIDRPEVVLDPGHGGEIDTGAIGPNGLLEAELNLRVAEALAPKLVARDIATSMTRTGDYLTPLSVRSAYADDLEAEIMVSIHHNAPIANLADGPGTEVFVQTGSLASRRLGGLLYEEVTNSLDQFDVAWTTALDASVLEVHLPDGTDAYGMIRRPETPTALVELAYIANDPEAELLATSAYIDVVSTALADAIEAYLRTDRPGTGYGNPPRVFTPDRAPGADVCVDPPLE